MNLREHDNQDGCKVCEGWCDWCENKNGKITHVINVKRMDITARFCSLECAARWGCEADQQNIEVRK